jgi:hypothetical protein
MNANVRKILILALVGSLFLVSVALAAPTAITIERLVFGGGGSPISGGSYDLQSTIGQPVTGTESQEWYDLCTGFWCFTSANKIHLPILLRP